MNKSTMIYVAVTMLIILSFQSNLTSQSNQACTGFESRLEVGMTARVTPGPANNVRAEPQTGAPLVGQIPGGDELTVIDGPVCADKFTWWQVDYDGLVGWTVEGTPEEYWIEPFIFLESTGQVIANQEIDVRDDILEGLAIISAGGAGNPYWCGFDFEEGDPPTLSESETEEIPEQSIFARDATIGDLVLESGRTFNAKIFTTPPTIIRPIPWDVPYVCSSQLIVSSKLAAVSPTGEIFMPKVVYESYLMRYTYHLPDFAILEQGSWELKVDDFIVNINNIYDYPVAIYLNQQLILRNFHPDERIAIVQAVYQTEITSASATLSRFLIQVDDTGGFVGTSDDLPNSDAFRISALIGEYGSVVSHGIDVIDADETTYSIPSDETATLLYETTWNQNELLLDDWTCPGALPIRLHRDKNAIVNAIRDEIPVYVDPNQSSNIITNLYPGDIFNLGNGVECADDAVWWWFYYEDFNIGWVMESQGNQYFLEPYDASISLRNRNVVENATQQEENIQADVAPTSIAEAMELLGYDLDEGTVEEWLNPNQQSKSVSYEQMMDFVNHQTSFPVTSLFRYGGTLDILKQLIENDFPVIIQIGYDLPRTGWGWMGKYMLITDYDDGSQEFVTYDAYRDDDRNYEYDYVDEFWQHFNYPYMVIYEQNREQELFDLLGDDAEAQDNLLRAYEVARAEANANQDDPFAWNNMSRAMVELSLLIDNDQLMEGAIVTYEQAQSVSEGLPWRMAWYDFGIYEAYLYEERYQDVVDMINETLSYDSSEFIEEMYYYLGMAHLNLGDEQDAIESFRKALSINPNFELASDQLDLLIHP